MDLGQDQVFHQHGKLEIEWTDKRFSVHAVLDGRSIDSGSVAFEIRHPARGHLNRIRETIARWADPREALTDFTDRTSSWVVLAVPNCSPGQLHLVEFYQLGRELFEAIHTRVYGAILISQAKKFQTHPTESG